MIQDTPYHHTNAFTSSHAGATRLAVEPSANSTVSRRDALDPLARETRERLGQVNAGVELVERDRDLVSRRVHGHRVEQLQVAQEDVARELVERGREERRGMIAVTGAAQRVLVLLQVVST